MITSGADIGGMGTHPTEVLHVPLCEHGDDAAACQLKHPATARHLNKETAAIVTGLSIITGLPLTAPLTAPPAPPSRARKIAAIHALADWLALPENAHLPMPTSILASVYIMPDDEIDQGVRSAAVSSVAAFLGDHVSRTLRMHSTQHYLFDKRPHDIEISYRVTAFTDGWQD